MIFSVAAIDKIDFRAKCKLSEKELVEYRRLSSCRKKDFLIGRVALKQALADYTAEVIDKKVTIKNGDSGLPYIEGWDRVYCSLSHSHNCGIGIVAPQRVGVDIEKIRPHKKSLLNYISNQREIDLVKGFLGSQTDIITLTWVIKESVMKGVGVGLGIPPKQVTIKRRINNEVFQVKTNNLKFPLWYVWPLEMRSFYIGIANEKNYRQRPNVNWYSSGIVPASRS